MQNLTIIYPYYNNPQMLRKQLYTWASYPPEIPIILIDDGSQEYPAIDVIFSLMDTKVDLKLYRVQHDIHWHQHGARNLGAHVAETEWLFMSDICRILTLENLDRMLKKTWEKNKYYKFMGVQMPGNIPTYQHPNSFLVQKKAYWKAGGYDEDYAGSEVDGVVTHGGYGGDGIFTKSLERFLTLETFEDIYLEYHDYIKDSKTPFPRKEGEYRENYFREMKRKKRVGDITPKNPIRFSWEEINLYGSV